MNRDEALAILSVNRAELEQRFGVRSIALFGSVARNEAGPDSDVDVLVELPSPASFDLYMGLLERLEDLLAGPVDLVSVRGLRPGVWPYVQREMIRVA